MSDTDTDDTDLLLLIPPNYYSTNTDAKKMNHHEDAMAMPPPPLPTTAAYRFLQPSKKTELNHINARLQNIELERFEAPSDLSTISSSTVRSTLGNKDQRALLGLVHSTPKNSAVPPRDHRPEANILHEIDNYLDNNHAWSGQQHHSDDHLRMRGYSVMAQESQQGASSLPSIRLGSSVSAMQDNKLISLSELWGKSNMAGTVIAAALPANQTVLKEEQLRRQHLEKIIQTLQAQLLEYQQRISVALEVDRSKDAALHQAAESTKALNFEVQQLRDTVHQLNTERSESQDKQDALQYELAQAVSLTTKFQEKTEILEAELKQHKQQASETLQQQEQLQLQLAATKRNEELTYVELNKLRDRFAKMDYQQEKLNTRIEELEKDKSTLQQQKEMLQEYHQKQKARADNLESQRRSLQEALSNLTDIETNLKKKLDVQQKSLKQQYQQQMENVVAKKLQEFQGQLDKLEEQLKAEARERERLIAERAVKQLEMINEKNNQELNLILEKHNEEVELYRLQLANASKKIDELELKLADYKTKRADIAEQLHGVMEAQWQQALAILTSPNQAQQQASSDTDGGASPELNNARHYPDTPKTSKTQRSNSTEKNNLDVVDKKDPPSPMDKLAAYIELLLSKSPSDFDKLDQILAMSSKPNSKPNKRSSANNKHPPWKS